MRKNSVVKKFHLSRLQTIINYSISLWLENFRVFNFRHTWHPTKIFSCRIFPKLRYLATLFLDRLIWLMYYLIKLFELNQQYRYTTITL